MVNLLSCLRTVNLGRFERQHHYKLEDPRCPVRLAQLPAYMF